MEKTEKFSLYAILLVAMTVFGMSISISGLSMFDFQVNMNATITELSFGVSLGSILMCIGSLVAAVTLKKWNRQIQYGIFSTILVFVAMIFPFCTSKAVFMVASGAQGFLYAFIGVIPNVWVMEIFQKDSKTFLQLMHIFFPVGNTIGSVIAAPFLSKNTTETDNITSPVADQPDAQVNLFATAEYSQLWIPYLVVCLLRLLVSAAVFVAFFIKPYRKPVKEESSEDKSLFNSFNKFEEAKKDIPKSYFWLFVSLICLVVGIELMNESNATTYLPLYLVKNNRLGLDSTSAAYCSAMLSTFTTIGRVVNIFLTMKIGIQTFLFINFTLMLVGNLLIMTAGFYSIYFIYVGIVFLGFGFSNSYPLMMALVEERISMSDRTMSLLNFTGSVFLVVSPITVGSILDSNPSTYMELTEGFTVVALAIYIVLVVLESRRMAGRSKGLK